MESNDQTARRSLDDGPGLTHLLVSLGLHVLGSTAKVAVTVAGWVARAAR